MIAIKMDMPESGVDEIDWMHERHKDCPLIELDKRLEADINVYQWICKSEKK